ncbi:hypothetical protein BDN71DRAFT_1546667 [Pleurotus eryngii]|uniref:Uncharacterized protein n=1 Tax=Pleurotus eryngii TaxID=5323 RepID=A0A9P5ZFJ5_PLEER|nr:hypothetical protein BDN71DRAFT_1546667 [Pleurotus eryngii]
MLDRRCGGIEWGVASDGGVGCATASGGCLGRQRWGGARRGHHGWGVRVGGDGVGGVGARASTFGHWTTLLDVRQCWGMLGGVGRRCCRQGTCVDVDGIGGIVGGAQWRWRRWAVRMNVDDVGGRARRHRRCWGSVGGIWCGGARQHWWACGCLWTLGGHARVDDDDAGGVGGMLGGVESAEVVVVEGGAVVREEKKLGGRGTNLRCVSSSFPAVPLHPRDVGLHGGILVLWGRWGQSKGMEDGGG